VAIRSFSVGPLRGLGHAEASELGNLVVLAGPNGAGKSTLLDLLRMQRHQLAEPGTQVMFVGPHRTWRSSQLNKVSVYGYTLQSFGALLQSDQMPAFQFAAPGGLQGLQGIPRDSSSADDAQAFVKTSLVRLRDRQQTLVTDAWEHQGNQVAPGSVPKLFEPFTRLIGTLLPHLELVGVVDVDQNNIQCRFRAEGGEGPEFDIDQLSSGEKAAIALMLPLIERQAELLITPAQAPPGVVPLTMLLDEPEIHMHPLLQLQVLQYMRELAAEGTAQFILSTQSTTLLDDLTNEELYLVSPAALAPDNQVIRLTTSHERLEVARAITGSTHLLTRSKPIVFVEGEPEHAGASSDVRIITNVLPHTRAWALVPGRAKRDVRESVRRLRSEGLELPGTPVFGLVDADRDDPVDDDHVVTWPVAMVENLLLDADAIHTALAPFGMQTSATNPTHVRDVLERLADQRRAEEVQLRIQRHLPVGRLAVAPGDLDRAEAVAAEQSARWLDDLRALDRQKLVETAQAEVDQIVAEGTHLERFHGKRILRALYNELGVAGSLSHSGFALQVAARAADSGRTQRLAAPALNQIRLYFPPNLASLIRELGAGSADGLAAECDAHYRAWQTGRPVADGRSPLRERVFAFGRSVNEDGRVAIAACASEIGTA
jgi:energy-coupling factor transporter ATP-binding protein EcfA2